MIQVLDKSNVREVMPRSDSYMQYEIRRLPYRQSWQNMIKQITVLDIKQMEAVQFDRLVESFETGVSSVFTTPARTAYAMILVSTDLPGIVTARTKDSAYLTLYNLHRSGQGFRDAIEQFRQADHVAARITMSNMTPEKALQHFRRYSGYWNGNPNDQRSWPKIHNIGTNCDGLHLVGLTERRDRVDQHLRTVLAPYVKSDAYQSLVQPILADLKAKKPWVVYT